MARFASTIQSRLSPEEAFSYLADFSNARHWDPSVSKATRSDVGEIERGSSFDLVARFAGRDVALHYTIVELDPPRRLVLEARRPGFVSRDTIVVEATDDGSRIHYDALLAFGGVRRLADPVMQRFFDRIGGRATDGLRAALNP